jgi:hypothetical protein
LPDRLDHNAPIPALQLQNAVTKALDTLGPEAREALFTHLHDKGIDLGNGSDYTLGQLGNAMESIFSKEATALIMEMVWNYLD